MPRPGDGCGQLLVGAQAGDVALVVLAVAGDGARGGWEYPGGLELPDLLNRAAGPASDVDGAH